MPKMANLFAGNKSSVGLLAIALIIGGAGAQASGLLNTASGGYLICVNAKTEIVTHPGTDSCPKAAKRLVLGTKGEAGANGLTGATGLSGKDGTSGRDGKTLWNGVTDPVSTWGAPGDMFINSVTKTLFGPKSIDGLWPTGVSMVGASGAAGPAGTKGADGPSGPSGPGGSGPAGSTGAQGPAGATGTSSLKITELSICGAGGNLLCKVGAQGPGGGLIFFVDYNDQYAGFNYLEAAPTDGVFASSAASGPWATTVATCGAGSNSDCQSASLYTVTGVSLSTIRGLHRGLFGGQAVTNVIVAKHSGVASDLFAAGVADTYFTATKSDYYLPTRDELELMQKNLNNAGVGGFVDSFYWSSSEGFAWFAWTQDFGIGGQGNSSKSGSRYVRPVRAF